MNREQIIKAWKDAEYRESLNEAERALLPEHPAGLIELSDAHLGAAAGGEEEIPTWWGCTTWWVWCTSRFLTYTCCFKEIA